MSAYVEARGWFVGVLPLFSNFLKIYLCMWCTYLCVAYVHESACVTIHVCVYVPIRAHSWGPIVNFKYLSQLCFTLFLTKSLLLNWLDWLVSETDSTSSFLWLRALDYTHVTMVLGIKLRSSSCHSKHFSYPVIAAALSLVVFRVLLSNPVWPWICSLCPSASFIMGWQVHVTMPGFYPSLFILVLLIDFFGGWYFSPFYPIHFYVYTTLPS